MAGAEGTIGAGAHHPRHIAPAAPALRTAAENLDTRTADIATGLARFSNSGLREWEKLAIDGRRTLAEVERTVRNIDRNPSRLLFGGSAAAVEEKPKR